MRPGYTHQARDTHSDSRIGSARACFPQPGCGTHDPASSTAACQHPRCRAA